MENNLFIKEYVLESSVEVNETVADACHIDNENLLIHICSIIHNTVLVQKLKSELSKHIPHAKIVLIKHEDRLKTIVQFYGSNSNYIDDNLESIVLNELYKENLETKKNLKDSKTQLLSRYFTDHLTNLPNQYQLRKDLHDGDNAGMISISIDNFAIINNFYGFIVGDFIIEKIGNYLKDTLNEKIYRVSGTEFAMIVGAKLKFNDLKEYLSDTYEKINEVKIQYQESYITVNLTLASCSSSSNENIFSKVSMALKYAKESKLPFWIYEDSMKFENIYEQNLKTSNKVRYAIENSKIIPYFQPILNNNTGKIEMYECLARLLDEDDTIISPLLFIPVAKKIKVYNQVTKIIINEAFRAFEDNEFDFSINLSIDDVMSTEIFDFIIEKLKNSPLANRVIFEILESKSILNSDRIDKFINDIKRLGARVAIDDFGNGYSNFSYLTKMNIDLIKIDGSLIKDIDTDKNSNLVVETIVEFAKKLGIKTVAKFVHSSTVIDRVKKLEIDYSQGFYIDKPLIEIK